MDPFKPYEPKPRAQTAPRLSDDDAQAVALQALAFIAGDDALLSRFVTLTGCVLDQVAGRMGDAGFLAAVLDFLLADEPALLDFVQSAGLTADTPMVARQKLGQ